MSDRSNWYFYEHQNGEIIPKRPIVVDSCGASEYFDSPFVVRYWKGVENWPEDLQDKLIQIFGDTTNDRPSE